jgi:Helix-turn-helix domain
MPGDLFDHSVCGHAARLAGDIVDRLADRLAVAAEPTPWLNVDQAAEHIAAPPSRIYDLVQRRAVPVRRDGERLLFKPSDLDDYLEGARRGEPAVPRPSQAGSQTLRWWRSRQWRASARPRGCHRCSCRCGRTPRRSRDRSNIRTRGRRGRLAPSFPERHRTQSRRERAARRGRDGQRWRPRSQRPTAPARQGRARERAACASWRCRPYPHYRPAATTPQGHTRCRQCSRSRSAGGPQKYTNVRRAALGCSHAVTTLPKSPASTGRDGRAQGLHRCPQD